MDSRLSEFIITARNSFPLEAFAREVSLSSGLWIDVVTYNMSKAEEGVVVAVGMDLESPEAFSNVDWRITIGGDIIDGCNTVLMRRSECMKEPMTFAVPIWVRYDLTIALQARSAVSASITHKAWGRISGARWTKIGSRDYVFQRLIDHNLRKSISPKDMARYGEAFCDEDPMR